jgi:hypothetical protein
LSQPIWLNFNIIRNGNFFIIDKYCYNGVFFINDIVSEDQQFLSYQEFQNKYMISTNFLEYYGIVGAVQKRWKKLILEYGSLHDIKNDIVTISYNIKIKPNGLTQDVNNIVFLFLFWRQ